MNYFLLPTEKIPILSSLSLYDYDIFSSDKELDDLFSELDGVKPEDVKFTKAVRAKENYGETYIIPKAIVETCKNCMITWPKGGELK